MSERWVPARGFEGRYEVSDMGRVRSVPRQVVRNGKVKSYPGKMLNAYLHHAHWKVVLYGDNKREYQVFVHRIVVESFVGPIPSGKLVRHLNDNARDNRLVNLKIGTHAENSHDAVRNGVHPESKRTECDYGHPLDGVSKKSRFCRTCARAKHRRLAAKKKLLARQSPGSGIQ